MTTLDERVSSILDRYQPAEQQMIAQRLQRVIIHKKAIARFPSPAYLCQFWRSEFVQTPMLDAIDDAVMQAEAGIATRWIINTPPQRGKTTRMQDAAAWMLLRNPRLNVVFASYEQGIAAQSSLAIRQMMEMHGSGYRGQRDDPQRVDHFGLMLDPDRAMQTRWSFADVPGKPGARPGGVAAVGVGGALTGRPADVVIVDDPIKDSRQADSEVWRKAVKNWFQSVVLTRLSRHAIVIVVQTRWHDEDLSGWLMSEDDDGTWSYLNVPAQAVEDDPLGREPGEWLIDARGFTPEDWARTRKAVGERTWFALYQGNPSPPEGGVFKRAWFDRERVKAAPEMLTVRTFIDPADNLGDGDEAGIITGGIGKDQKIYILADDSGHFTVAQWYRQAIFSMLRHHGTKLYYERSLSGLKRSMQSEWRTLRTQAARLHAVHGGGPWPEKVAPEALSAALRGEVGEVDEWGRSGEIEAQLKDLWPFVPQVLALPAIGPSIEPVKAVGTKSWRAENVAPFFENGTARMVGHFDTLERQSATWLPTQNSPDRMDAMVHLVTKFGEIIQNGSKISKPTGSVPRTDPRARARRQIPRSVASRR